jgi:Ca2+-binding RTX toxin-like protein
MLSNPISQNHLVLAPQSSTSPGETHAALVVSQASFSDVRFSAGFQTLEQLRTGSAPNAWECAWAVFNYTDNTHFYYVAFKPNGWELGKADPAYPGAQRFLATGSSPASAIGSEHSFDIQQDGNVIKVWLDGVLLTTFTDNERPYLGGKVGFYTEDATVAFDNVTGSITENFEGYAAQTFGDGGTLGAKWTTPFVGYGFAGIRSDGTMAEVPPPAPAPSAPVALADPVTDRHLVLSPQASTSAGETHAAMVVSQASFANVRFSAGFETLDQLRTGSAPNPWECAWAVFNYTDNTHFYYVAFKPNGWELGKADPAYAGAQRFLATGSSPASAVGTEHSFSIHQDANVISVWLDGVLLTTFTDNERPYLSGKVGFYTEDATVAFDNVTGSISEDFEGFAEQTVGDGGTLGAKWTTPFVGFGFAAIQDDGGDVPAPLPATRPAPSNLFDLWKSTGPVNTITGTSSNNQLTGTSRHDLIDGRGGADRMTGRGGDDTYRVDNTGDRIVERAWEGIDTVLSSASSHTLGAYVENLTLVGTAAQTGVGNALDNILVANDVRGILRGGDGHDLLVSGKGNDLLTGGAHSDTFIFMQAATAVAGTVRHITDFQPGVDKIDVHHLLAAYAGADAVADGRLALRANGQGGTDILVDADGAGGAAAALVVAVDGVAAADLQVGRDLFWT